MNWKEEKEESSKKMGGGKGKRYISGDAANVKNGAGRVVLPEWGGEGCYFPGGLIPAKYNLLFTGMVPIYASI
jgi:hypothetical protein